MSALVIFLIILCLYLFPSIIASNRRHNNASAITVLNIFLGWTFLGWVISLVWALTDNVETPSNSSPPSLEE